MSTTRIALIEAYQAAIISIAKRGTFSKARSAVSATERVAAIIGKGVTPSVNKAPV